MSEAALLDTAACSGCGTELPPGRLSCPACHRLVHAESLRRLADEAETAAATGESARARDLWREALTLLPHGSRQWHAVSAKLATLNAALPAHEAAHHDGTRPAWTKAAGLLGVLALLLWKFKFVLVFVLTKAKLLLLGLTKTSTLLSMFLSWGVYWSAWGWKFALGFIACMYVHEIGHVAALQRLGIKATAPMFVPGLGAFVRMKDYPASPSEDARVGLAGPLWGLGAALACYAVFLATAAPFWAALTRSSAWLNLFNLLPVWQLDGGRGFRALTRGQRIVATTALALAWGVTQEGLLGLLTIAALVRTFAGHGAVTPDKRALREYAVLVAALAALTLVGAPKPTA